MNKASSKNIVIFGATSRIAECVAREFSARGDLLTLIGRNEAKLGLIAKDLTVRGAKEVRVHVQDLNKIEELPTLIDGLFEESSVDTVLVAHGVLPEQEVIQDDLPSVLNTLDLNFSSPMAISLEVVKRFEEKDAGSLAVITSVAGLRGRKSNYIYGTAKGALILFLQGLRNRVGKTNVRVIDVRPGFVDTPMTAHLKKGALFASPESVAKGIVLAIDKGKDIVYLPWFWRWIMLIIKSIPEFLFKKMSI